METHVAVGTYNVLKTKEIEGNFSKMRQELLDAGWSLRGDLQSHVNTERHLGELRVFVTLIQDFTR